MRFYEQDSSLMLLMLNLGIYKLAKVSKAFFPLD